MGNVNSKDNWQVHFRDTMRGGKFLNNWRMAELHAKEAPDRVWELETYGALFDRTPDGKISQRNFGGHEYPRLAHVGDRTGLELIRTLQQKIVSLQQEDFARARRLRGQHQGLRRVHDHRAAQGRRRDRRRLRLLARVRPVRRLRGAGGHPRHRRHRQVVQGHQQLLGVHRRRARARAAAGATLINMEFVQFHPTGMVWPPSVKGILVTESVRGDGGVLTNSEGKRFMFDYVPDVFRKQYAETEEEARPLVQRPRQQPASARAAAPRRGRPRDQLRGQGRPRLPARRRLPRRLHAAAGRGHPQEAAVDVPPVQGAGRRRHHRRADGGRPDLPLRHGRRRGRPRHRGRAASPACSRPARSPAACTARTGSAATRCPTCSCSAAGPARRGRLRRVARRRRPTVDEADVDAARPRPLAPFRGRGRREPVHAPPGAAADDERPGRHHPHRGRDRGGARPAARTCKARASQVTVEGHRQFNPGWHLALDLRQHAAGLRVRREGGAGARGVPRRPHPRRLPGHEPGVAQGQPGLLGRRRRRRSASIAAAAPADAARAARAVRRGRADEVHDRRGARAAAPGSPGPAADGGEH